MGLKEKDTNYAQVEIEGSSRALIEAAAITTFTEQGFKLISELENRLHFRKDGSLLTAIIYSTSFLIEKTTIDPKLTILPNNEEDGFILICDVFIIEHFKGLDSHSIRLTKNGHRGYMKLLNQIKAVAEEK